MADEARELRKRRAAERRAKILASSESRMAVVEGSADSASIRQVFASPDVDLPHEPAPEFIITPSKTLRDWSKLKANTEFARAVLLWLCSAIMGFIAADSAAMLIVALHIAIDTPFILAWRYVNNIPSDNIKLLYYADFAEGMVLLWNLTTECFNNLALSIFVAIVAQKFK